MKKAEIILGIIAFIALILKFLSITGNGLLTVLSLMSLSLIYTLFSFALFNNIRFRHIFKKESYSGISPKKLIGTIGLGFAFSAITNGVLFKFQAWPGFEIQLQTGLILTLIILIIANVAKSKSQESNFYKGIFTRIIIIGGVGLLTLLTPNDELMQFLHRNNPELLNKINSQQ
jgi:hypothetical protein